MLKGKLTFTLIIHRCFCFAVVAVAVELFWWPELGSQGLTVSAFEVEQTAAGQG